MFQKLMLLFICSLSMNALAAPTMVNGAGATFPEPIYAAWFSKYTKIDTDTIINYQGVGSGAGIRQLIAGTVDFGASDTPMTDEEMKSVNQVVAHIPTIMGAVVVSYNLKVEKPLKLSGPVVADLFSGKITKWNDAKIAQQNPGVSLPNLPVVVATRADGSGTTAVFTDYLSKVSVDWKGKAGKTVDWFKGVISAKGNAGVTGLIKQTEGTVGYVELVYALENKMAFALIKNSSGEYVEANIKSVSAAAGGKIVAEMIKNDFKLSVTDSSIKTAYPISSFSWLLIKDGMDKTKGSKLLKMLNWALSDEGQKIASDSNFAPIPTELRQKVIARLAKIKM